MEGKVLAKDLHRLAYNALLYANKSRSCRGYTLWIRGGDQLRVVTTNDYFILVDQIQGLDHYRPVVEDKVMPLDFLKLLERELRDQDGEFDLSDLQFTVYGEMTDLLWMADGYVFDLQDKTSPQTQIFALNPDDLRKLALVKPQGYPLDFQAFEGAESIDLFFKIGPYARGAVATLNREIIKDDYQNGEMW